MFGRVGPAMSLRHPVGVLPGVGAAIHVHGALPVAGLDEVFLGGFRVALLLIDRSFKLRVANSTLNSM